MFEKTRLAIHGYLLNTWWPEYAATGLSLIFMLIILSLLLEYDNKSLSDWHLPSTVSPNAVIAALNTLSRMSSAFALASAIGQWKWIKASQEKKPLQFFVYVDKASRGALGSMQVVWHTRASQELDGPQAWVKSLDAEENQWVATKSFTHGNITITNVVNATFWSSGNTYLPSVSNFTATTLSKAWQFLPQWPAPGTGSEIIVQQFINPDSSNLGYILNVTMVNLTNLESLKNWPTGADLVALECSLTWCLQNVTSSLTNNILTQTFSPLPNTSLTYVDLSNTPITQPNNGINEFNLTSAFGTREKYSVMVPDMAEMADLLLDQLLWSGSDTTGNNTEYDVPLAQVGFGNTAEPMGSPALQAIYSHGNFTDTFDNLARALTNALFASDNTTTVYGSLGVSSIVMTVQWYWLALPFFNVVAAAVFIRITVAASSRANAPLWKANLLPVLFHGFLHNEGDENDEVASKKKMKSLRRGTAMHRFAKTVDVKLEGVEDGGRGAALSATRRRLRNRKGRDSAQYMAV
ncbi:hypothetical protein MMC10_000281 [Thelotrema lepadinum]|nr:hypothetical protein [Thelotrema lepadinum]